MTVHHTHAKHSGHRQEAADAAGFAPDDAIARRAYELFQERGGEPGRDIDDWLHAEHELKAATSHHPSETR
jgi:hypothetical protein